jgi:hypothetical protein
MKKLFILLLALPLGGCFETLQQPITLNPICEAIIGPIQYNSTNKASSRYAAPNLVSDLKERNDVGVRLNCPQYR